MLAMKRYKGQTGVGVDGSGFRRQVSKVICISIDSRERCIGDLKDKHLRPT